MSPAEAAADGPPGLPAESAADSRQPSAAADAAYPDAAAAGAEAAGPGLLPLPADDASFEGAAAAAQADGAGDGAAGVGENLFDILVNDVLPGAHSHNSALFHGPRYSVGNRHCVTPQGTHTRLHHNVLSLCVHCRVRLLQGPLSGVAVHTAGVPAEQSVQMDAVRALARRRTALSPYMERLLEVRPSYCIKRSHATLLAGLSRGDI